MKKLVTSYTFDASAKTIDAADFMSLEKIQLITNVTDNIIIYNFASPTKGGSLAGTVLTLDYDTTSMDDTDKLQIFVEDGAAVQAVSASSLPLPAGAATAANQQTDALTDTQLRASAVPVSATQSGTWTVQPGNTANTTAWKVDGSAVTQPVSYATTGSGTSTGAMRVELPTNGTGVVGLNAGTQIIGQVYAATRTINGATMFTLISAASTNATSLKGSAGTLYTISAYNNGASEAYLKFYNKATAPTVGTDTAVMTILLPAGGGSNITLPPMGVAFGTGIAYAVTGLGTTADTTAVGAAQVFVNGSYV